MKDTKTALFFNAWHSDLKKSGVKTKKLGEITLSIREKQAFLIIKYAPPNICKEVSYKWQVIYKSLNALVCEIFHLGKLQNLFSIFRYEIHTKGEIVTESFYIDFFNF